MTARVLINPNLRLDDLYTVANLDEDVEGELGHVFDTVIVFEPESQIIGKGWVTEIDQVDRTVTILVDWANLRIEVSTTTGRVADPNRTVASVPGAGGSAPSLQMA